MGIFDKLFGKKDPAADLSAAEQALGRGDGVRALELARRALRHGEGDLAARAQVTIDQARAAIVDNALATAAEREEAELYDEAADWVEIALDHVTDDRRSALEARREALLDHHEASRQRAPDRERDPTDRGSVDREETTELELDEHYELLVDMLREDVADRYRDRSEGFRRACVALSEGATDVALPLLDRELDRELQSGDEAITRFERGRCHLLAGDYEAARADLEAAWESLGDEPLDSGGALSVPELWAQASEALGRPEEIVERLAQLAEPGDGHPDLCEHYAAALVALGHDEEAEPYLEQAMRFHPSRQAFPLLLARVLARQERRDEAIDLLETAIAPSCATGNCAKPPLHPPSLRALAELHLGADSPRLGRVDTLLSLLARARRGQLTAADQQLVARYRRATGDEEGAAEADIEAARLKSREAATTTMAPAAAPSLGGGDRIL